jgi:hypothetical protein
MSELKIDKVSPRTGTYVSLNTVGMKNIIINGDMSLAQRSTSVASITTSGFYTLDRMSFVVSNQGTWTQSQSTDVPSGQGFSNSFKLDCTTADASPAAGDVVRLQQGIEGLNLQYLKYGTANAESLTLSFWVKSNKTGTYVIQLLNGAVSRQVGKTYTIDSADTWEKKTITFPGDTSSSLDNDNSAELYVMFCLGTGTDRSSGTLSETWKSFVTADQFAGQTVNLADDTANEWYITGVQLEAGTTASDFEFLPVDVNLARCQRYFYKIESSGTTSNNNITTGFTYGTAGVQSNVKMEVLMRATPSFSYDIGANGLVLYNNVDSVTASVPKVYAFAPFGGLMYFDSDLSGTFGASHRPVNVSFNTSPTQTKVLKFSAEL